MKKIELEVDDATYDEASKAACGINASLELVMLNFISCLGSKTPEPDPVLGLFSDDPDLMEAVCRDAMQARERDPLRAA